MSKNKKILFSGIFLAAVAAILLFAPTKVAQAGIAESLLWALNKIIYGIFLLLANLLKVAGMLFDWSVKPKGFTAVVGSEAVRNGWKMVRDFFNIAFILVLLFSAFSTIFQVEKYHIKKILLHLVIIALLVNFSYPIAMFIIDASNVLMYYLLNMAFPENGGSISSGFVKWSRITDAMVPRVGDAGSAINMKADDLTMKLIMAIVMIFVLTATIMTMAILLVVRMVALAILVIFAPAGFVSSILPSTKNYSDDWWKNLFKYSFMGPTLAFMIVLGLKMMTEMNNAGPLDQIEEGVISNLSKHADVSFLTTVTFFSIPIVIMWSGMIVAQKLGVAGAGFAVKMGQGAAKKFSGFNAGKRLGKSYLDARKAAKGPGKAERLGKWFSKKQDQAYGSLAYEGDNKVRKGMARMTGMSQAKERSQKTRENDNREDIKKRADSNTKSGKDLLLDLNTNYKVALDKKTAGKRKKELAGNAQALRNMQDVEIHLAIEDSTNMAALKASALAGDGIFTGTTPAEALKIQRTLDNIESGSGTKDEYNRIMSYIKTQSSVVNSEGVKNG